MGIGARPLDARGVRRIVDRKASDFRVRARGIVVRHLGLDAYLEAAADDREVRFELEVGYLAAVADVRDPVLVDVGDRVVVVCPPLATRVLAGEPAELHRAFVEGTFLRKLFRFFVPATHDGGASWEAVEQVRDIMQRHFALPLVAAETVLSRAA